MSGPNVTEFDNNGERAWKINWPLTVQLPQLEDIADGIEAGEILPGAFVINLGPDAFDALDPELVRRLGAFVKRGPGSARIGG